MENCIKISGTIVFDPANVTNKQERQSEWKKVAMVLLEPKLNRAKGDKGLADYYAWFIKKRYNLPLHRPLRDAHVTFINDRASDMNGKWEDVKSKWQGKKIDIILNVDPRSDGLNWWINIPEEHRKELHAIRAELGLGRPHWGLHMTIGTAVNFKGKPSFKGINAMNAMLMNEEQSKYIVNLIRDGYSY